MAIITQLQDSKIFFSHNNLLELYAFLESCQQDNFAQSDYRNNKRIDFQSGAFALLQTYNLKSNTKAFFETHKKYIDLQFTVKGAECFHIGSQKNFTIKHDYNEQKDLIVYHAKKQVHQIIATPGNLCIFFPTDVHAGGLKHKEIANKSVMKVVIKVPIHLLDKLF